MEFCFGVFDTLCETITSKVAVVRSGLGKSVHRASVESFCCCHPMVELLQFYFRRPIESSGRSRSKIVWYLLPRKGIEFPSYNNVAQLIVDDLNWLGYNKAIFRSDGENVLKAVLSDIKDRWKR